MRARSTGIGSHIHAERHWRTVGANGLVSEDPTVGACWDADRLDLPRVGIQPDPALFSTARAHEGPPDIAEPPHRSTPYARING